VGELAGKPQLLPSGGRSPEKYQRILDAAVAVFAEKGFSQARVADVAGRASVADGTIYLYFRNKEELLMAAITNVFNGFLDRARSELRHIAEPQERLRLLARLHLQTLGSNRPLAVVLQMELRQSAKFLGLFSRQQLLEYLKMIRGVIQQGQEAGVFHAGISDKIAANCFFGALDQMVTSWVLSRRDYPLADTADAVVDTLLKGMESRTAK
jgi:TetR/AcrR family transcriptional regulator, fatty acid metabolism regulator protein